jgi:EmrB/QacA subfamily drug resistance transporter
MSVFSALSSRFRPDSAQPRRPSAILAIIALGYLMIVLDTTIVNVALPSIQTDLHFSSTSLAWVLNGYFLSFGGLILLAGRAGDVFGRRRVFQTGIGVFATASLLGGLAPSAGILIAMRVLQGAGAALIAPNTMALLAANFAEGPTRNRALSVYSAVALTGGSIGLLLGGVLTTWATWRWTMFVVVPVGLVIIALAPRLLAETERRAGRFDLGGAVTSTLGMSALVYGLIRAAAVGWTTEVWTELAIGGVLLAVFVAIEARAGQPIVPLRLFARRQRTGAYLNIVLLTSAMFGTFFLLTQYLQTVRGFGPFEAGLAFLPQTGSAFAAVRLAPRIVARFGLRPPMIVGAALVATGMTLLSRITPDSPYLPNIVVPIMLLGAGLGSSFLPLNATILTGIAPGEAGAASGVAQAMQWVGGSLGISVLVTVFGATAHAAAAGRIDPVAFSAGATSAFGVAAMFVATAFAVAVLVLRTGGEGRRVAGPELRHHRTGSPTPALEIDIA